MNMVAQALSRAEILKLIPHQGSMCLLDRVCGWSDEALEARTLSHLRVPHPLASDGRLRAIHLCEYGAQAMAIHGGLLGLQRGVPAQPGLLVSLRAVQLNCDFFETYSGELVVRAESLLVQPASWQYQFTVLHGGELLATGRAAVMAAVNNKRVGTADGGLP